MLVLRTQPIPLNGEHLRREIDSAPLQAQRLTLPKPKRQGSNATQAREPHPGGCCRRLWAWAADGIALLRPLISRDTGPVGAEPGPVDAERLVLGGYLGVPRAEREGWQSDLLPPRFISVSECLTGVDHGPEFWAWHTDPAAAAACWGGALLAIGFTSGDAASLAQEITSDLSSVAGQVLAQGVPECLELLAAAAPMPDDTQLRGFEVIGVEFALSRVHSWLCHGYESDVAAALDLRLNQWGLLDTYPQASSVLAWMEALPAEQAPEPVHWTIAALAESGANTPAA
jgi:hypothetical protein